jgi:hypothetical protein
VATEYTDLATIKAALNVPEDDTSRDALLSNAISAASRGIDRDTGRRFWLDPDPVTRTFDPVRRVVCDDSGDRLLVDDIGDATGLTVESGFSGAYSPITTFETGPDNAILRGRPVTSLLLTAGVWGYRNTRVRVTARWGWPEVPEEIAQAAQIQAMRLYRRKDSPEGVTGSAEWGVVRLARVDPDVYALIKHFVLPGFG